MQMNLSIHKALPMRPNIGSRQRIYKRNIISCWTAESGRQKRRSDFYEVLSLGSRTVGLAEIKKAYRSKALQYHPDVCPPSSKEESKQRFIELRKAYETLSNPTSRRIHDYELGLVSSLRYGSEAFQVNDRIMTSFPQEVWEKQLNGLKQRSNARMQMRKNKAYI